MNAITKKKLRVLLIEAFYSGSHRQWAQELKHFSEHKVSILSLPGRYWKWRMHGAAITLARQFMQSDLQPDLLLFTDMIDVNVFLSLTRERTHSIPSILYFHENQISYPWSDNDPDVRLQRDRHYGFINYASALAVQRIIFNSAYHQHSFIEALAPFLGAFPDHQNKNTITIIRDRATIVPLGFDLSTYRPLVPMTKSGIVILWNHRWEYDKNPKDFFSILMRLKQEKINFKLIILGERSSTYPPVFDQAMKNFKEEILHCGYVSDRATYIELIQQADILPVTSVQDFFGISIVEAIAAGVYPLLPDRLAYREHIDPLYHPYTIYSDQDDLYHRLISLLTEGTPDCQLQSHIARYDWDVVGKTMDHIIRANDSCHPTY